MPISSYRRMFSRERFEVEAGRPCVRSRIRERTPLAVARNDLSARFAMQMASRCTLINRRARERLANTKSIYGRRLNELVA